MHFKGLSAWITTPEGDHLTEYKTIQQEDNKIECWVPSTEGANFEIHWKAEVVQPEHVLRCSYCLDGIPGASNKLIAARSLASGQIMKRQGQRIGPTSQRLFCFGKRELTDDEDIAPLDRTLQNRLNTIEVSFQWGCWDPSNVQRYRYKEPKVNGPIHEKVAKKGHAGSAGFGRTTSCEKNSDTCHAFVPNSDLDILVFIFRYAPKEWLEARDIIPQSSQSTTQKRRSSSSPNATQKRARSSSPELIDIDDLETDDDGDDDDIVVVKHMIPAPGPSVPKRRKIKGEEDVKTELGR